MTKSIFNWYAIYNVHHAKKRMSVQERRIKSDLYDILYEKADFILKKYKPCLFKNGKCRGEDDCCGYCRYLKNKCTVKALTCKLWLCGIARKKFPECAASLDALALVAQEYGLLGFRTSKDDIL